MLYCIELLANIGLWYHKKSKVSVDFLLEEKNVEKGMLLY